MSKKYIDLKEAAEYAKIPVSTLRRKISDGELPGYKPAKHVLVEIGELDLFIRKSRVSHAS